MKKLFNEIDSKVWLIAIFILALILRLTAINQSFWLDEATSGLVVRDLSFSQIINEFSIGDFHPPFYYLLLKGWSFVFGSSEIALRSLSVIFGVASVYLTYLVGAFFNKKTGLLSSLLLAVNGLHIYYSQEARMYSMSVFLVLSLVYLFIKLQRSKNNIHWYLFSSVLVLNAFIDYLPNLIIAVFWIFALIHIKDKSWWKKFILAHVPLLITLIFWMPKLITQIQNGLSVGETGSLWWGVLGQTNMKNILLIPIKFVFGRISFYNKFFYYGLSVFVIFSYFVIFLRGLKKKLISDEIYKIVSFWLIVPTLLLIIIGFGVSVLSYFRLIFVLPALLILLSVSIGNLSIKWKYVATAFVVCVSIISSAYYLFNPRFHRENWSGLVSYIAKESTNTDLGVVFASGGQREGYKYYRGPDIVKNIDSLDPNLSKLLYVRYVQDIFDPKNSVRKTIEDLGYEVKKIHDFNGIIVWEYENRD